MIQPREVLVRPGIIDSERVCGLSLACQLFFRNLLHCGDGKGRFPADAAELRSALYWRTPAVSSPHVEAWLQSCARARLVKLYTRDGKKFGEIIGYGQRDTKRRTLYPDPEGQEEFALPAPEPPPKPPRAPKEKRSEGKGEDAQFARRAAAEPPRAPAPPVDEQLSKSETEAEWLARLQQENPAVNVRTEIIAAMGNRRLQGRKLERKWFETHWLPNVSEPVGSAPMDTRQPIEPEPEAWGVWLEHEYPNNAYGKGGAKEGTPWAELPAEVRAKIHREMTGVTKK